MLKASAGTTRLRKTPTTVKQAVNAMPAHGTPRLDIFEVPACRSMKMGDPFDPATEPTDTQLTESVLRWLDMVGLDPAEVGERLVVTPACGLAGASPTWASIAMNNPCCR